MKTKSQINKKRQHKGFLTAADFMPFDVQTQKVLRASAEILAKEPLRKSEIGTHIAYIRFRLGAHDYYGIPYQAAKEVMPKTTLTQVPCVPEFVAGIVNRRGILLTVINLKKLFRLPLANENNESAYIIVIAEANMLVGLMVDKIEGSDLYDPVMLDPPLAIEGIVKPEYILGLHRGMTAIINAKAILADLIPQLSSMEK